MPDEANGPEDRGTAEAVHETVETAVRARPPRGRPRPARARPVLASYSSPTGPALRANPFPEVTDLICRLPLPTLFYRLEAVHLGDLLRMWVRSGTKVTMPPSDFQGPTEVPRTPQEPRCFTGTTSLSPDKPIPGSPSLTKKRELFPGLPPTSPSLVALPHMAQEDQTPMPGSGILTRFPFDRMRASSFWRWQWPRFRTEFPYLLGPTDPCSTAVHMEPFSPSVFKVLV